MHVKVRLQNNVDILLKPGWVQSHKSNNVSDNYLTMHHFVTEMRTRGMWDKCIVGFVQ